MAKAKTFGANLPVPQNREEASGAIVAIGDLGRQLTRLEADMNDEIARSKQAYEEAAEPLRQAKVEKTEGLKMWAEANRAALTGGDKTKTVDLGTGKIMWRLRPPAVTLRGIGDIVERLKERSLQRFLRVKVDIDKEALLREPDVARSVAGVSIGSAGEDFIVEPYEAQLAQEPQS